MKDYCFIEIRKTTGENEKENMESVKTIRFRTEKVPDNELTSNEEQNKQEHVDRDRGR